MKVKQFAFTLIESMLSLLVASLLAGVLISTFIAFKACYQRVMTVAVMQDDGRFAIAVIRRDIHRAGAVDRIVSHGSLSGILKRKLKSKSDVLILKESKKDVAFYVAKSSWKRHGKFVDSLFEKPLDGRRMELVPDITGFHVKWLFGGVSYDITVRSAEPILRFVNTLTDRYLKRTWHGYAITQPKNKILHLSHS
jgi:hypothetical protein